MGVLIIFTVAYESSQLGKKSYFKMKMRKFLELKSSPMANRGI